MASEVAPESTATASRAGGILATIMNPGHRGSSHRIEFIAGLTTFVTMAYIIFVNASIMEAAGLNFDPRNSHLINRPREIVAIWGARHESGERFVPWNGATAALAVISESRPGPQGVERYKVLNAFRPWWASHWYMPSDQRPVPIGLTFLIMGGTLLSGLGLIRLSRVAQTNSHA